MMRALQNAQRRAVAALHGPEIHSDGLSQILQQLKTHSDGLSQILQRPKYTATGCRKFATAQNTQRRAVAALQQLKTHSDGLSQILQRPKYTATGPRRRVALR